MSFAVLDIQKLKKSIRLDEVKKMDEEGKINRNYNRPPVKDTITVPVGGYTVIRFLADNPGTWMYHCHLDFHSEVGMGLLIKIGNVSDLPPQPTKWPKCGNFFFTDKSTFWLNNTNRLLNSFSFQLFIYFIVFIIIR